MGKHNQLYYTSRLHKVHMLRITHTGKHLDSYLVEDLQQAALRPVRSILTIGFYCFSTNADK